MSVDERTHYQVLGLTPECNRPAIEAAWQRIRTSPRTSPELLAAAERAYAVLADPNAKRRYDAELDRAGSVAAARELRALDRGREPEPAPRPSPVVRGPRTPRRGAILAVVLTLLGLVLALSVWPAISWRFGSFAPGTSLLTRDGRPVGTVVAFESNHAFPGGAREDAYLVRSGSGSERWLTRRELHRVARRAPAPETRR